MYSKYREYVREGTGRCDLTKLFANPAALTAVIEDMARPFLDQKIDKVVALDALGFVFGTRVAERLNAGLVLMRKGGKISFETESISFTDYSKTNKIFEIAHDSIKNNDRVIIVDDWSETGAQLKAAIGLIEKVRGHVIGAACLNIDKPVLEDIALSKYMLHSVLR